MIITTTVQELQYDLCVYVKIKSLVGHNIDGLAQDCSNSNALAMESLQSCAKPSIPSIPQILQSSYKHIIVKRWLSYYSDWHWQCTDKRETYYAKVHVDGKRNDC